MFEWLFLLISANVNRAYKVFTNEWYIIKVFSDVENRRREEIYQVVHKN